MNSIFGILIALLIIIIILVIAYNYLNMVRADYKSYDADDIKKLHWYDPPRWILDAWNVTYAGIIRKRATIGI